MADNYTIDEDDGKFNFGDLDGEAATAVGDYDFSDLDEGTDPDTVAVKDYDFNKLAGDLWEIEEWIHDYLYKYIKEAILDTAGLEYPISVYEDDTGMNVLLAEVFYQYFYNPLTNKVFIEFTFNTEYVEQFNEAATSEMIIRYVKANIRKDDKYMRPWPEIVMLEDGVNERCDTSQILTPFTIGYWKSLSGNYNFITDQIEITEVWKQLIPEFPDGFNEDLDTIYNQYYTSDFNKFSEELYKLMIQYKVKFDDGPTKKVTDFFNQVIQLNKEYRNPKLEGNDWTTYNQRYGQLVIDYKDPEEFKTHLDELNSEYGITMGLNNKVPEMFEKYRVKFKDFFNSDNFPNMRNHIYRYGIKVNKLVDAS